MLSIKNIQHTSFLAQISHIFLLKFVAVIKFMNSIMAIKWSIEFKFVLLVLLVPILLVNAGKKSKSEEKPAWAKKDIRDYNDADLERLLDQWDVSARRRYFTR